MLINQVNYQQIFVWNPRTIKRTVSNATGSDVNLAIGTVMGRITSTLYVTPQVSSASDGSQVPRGVLVANYTIPANSTQEVEIVVQGDIVSSALTLGGSDTLDTLISVGGDTLGTIGDIMIAAGMLLVPSTELTYPDNGTDNA